MRDVETSLPLVLTKGSFRMVLQNLGDWVVNLEVVLIAAN